MQKDSQGQPYSAEMCNSTHLQCVCAPSLLTTNSTGSHTSMAACNVPRRLSACVLRAISRLPWPSKALVAKRRATCQHCRGLSDSRTRDCPRCNPVAPRTISSRDHSNVGCVGVDWPWPLLHTASRLSFLLWHDVSLSLRLSRSAQQESLAL